MNLYTEAGWLNFEALRKNQQPFNIVLGARGIGKTYGALKEVYEKKINTLMIRTTQSQADFICDDNNTPFKSVLDDLGVTYKTKKLSKYTGGIFTAEIIDDVPHLRDRICTTAALSTFHNLRGFDGSEIQQIVYDEFNEENAKLSKQFRTGTTFFNLYETVNRNRELQGKPPVICWLFGNANDIFNDVLIEFQLISKICEMQRNSQEMSIMPDRGIALYVLQKSPISQAKRKTALYRATRGSEIFQGMALDNIFKGVDYNLVKPLPLNQIKAVAACGEICLYKVKSTGKDYVSLHRSGSPKEYTQAEFCSLFDRLAFEIAFERGVTFETPEAKILTKRILS